jgi:hypothetical protein
MNQPPVFTIDNIIGPNGPEVIQIEFESTLEIERHSKEETMVELYNNINDINKILYNLENDFKRIVPRLGMNIDPRIIALFNVQINPNEYYLEEHTYLNGWTGTNIFKAPVRVRQPAPVQVAQPAPVPVVRAAEVLPEGEASIPFVQRFQCSICLTNAVNTRLNPCGHLLCSVCFSQLNPKICPICRVEPVNEEPIFYGGYYNKYQKYINKLNNTSL